MAGRQLPRTLEDAARFCNVTEREVLFDGKGINLATQTAMRKQCLEFGTEHKAAVGKLRIEQWLDAEAVARQE